MVLFSFARGEAADQVTPPRGPDYSLEATRNQQRPLWEPGDLRTPAENQVQSQWDIGEPWGPAEAPEASQSPRSEPQSTSSQGTKVQEALQWQVILQKLNPDDQTLLVESIVAEKEAATKRVAAVATQELAQKDSEIATLRAALARHADGLLFLAEKPNRQGSRRLTVSGQSYTALSSLYSSTAGALWTTKTNWMSGDPCTSSW